MLAKCIQSCNAARVIKCKRSCVGQMCMRKKETIRRSVLTNTKRKAFQQGKKSCLKQTKQADICFSSLREEGHQRQVGGANAQMSSIMPEDPTEEKPGL